MKRSFPLPFKLSGKLSWSHFYFADIDTTVNCRCIYLCLVSFFFNCFKNINSFYFSLCLCCHPPIISPDALCTCHKSSVQRRKWNHPGCWSLRMGRSWTWMSPSTWAKDKIGTHVSSGGYWNSFGCRSALQRLHLATLSKFSESNNNVMSTCLKAKHLSSFPDCNFLGSQRTGFANGNLNPLCIPYNFIPYTILCLKITATLLLHL